MSLFKKIIIGAVASAATEAIVTREGPRGHSRFWVGAIMLALGLLALMPGNRKKVDSTTTEEVIEIQQKAADDEYSTATFICGIGGMLMVWGSITYLLTKTDDSGRVPGKSKRLAFVVITVILAAISLQLVREVREMQSHPEIRTKELRRKKPEMTEQQLEAQVQSEIQTGWELCYGFGISTAISAVLCVAYVRRKT